MSNIFRAYDVRGIYPEEINTDIAKRVGNAVARYLKAPSVNSGQVKTVVVGEDGRIGSPELRQAVIGGITAVGADVIYIGQCTTPLFYFSVNKLKADGGIMITASHNPQEYNGLKIVGRENVPVSSDTGLLDIKKFSESEIVSDKTGNISTVSVKDDYIGFLSAEAKDMPDTAKGLKLVIDASNGMAPLVLGDLLKKLGLSYTPIYFDIDGTFPNHSPDTSKEENLRDLKSAVLEEKADLGIAFDGDGDRITLVDEQGNIAKADFITAVIYQHFYSGKQVVYDHRFSRSVKEFFGANGIASKTGHSFIKTTLRNQDADFGGELSGHFFYKEFGYADSAILTMIKVVKILAGEHKPLSDVLRPFSKYFNSGEINIEFDGDKIGLISLIKQKYADGKINELDGITVEYDDWWFNLRPSNTEPLLRLVVEANTKELMGQKIAELTSEINKTA